MNRRHFLQLSTAAAGFAALPTMAATAAAPVHAAPPVRGVELGHLFNPPVGKASKPLKVLVLGGRKFVGPPLVQRLAQRGHAVTLFNRSQTNTHLFADLPHIKGDRDPAHTGGLENLRAAAAKERWDWVVDTWDGDPASTAACLDLLADRCNRWFQVSTISVYGRKNYQELQSVGESALLPEPPPPVAGQPLSYPVRKLMIEKALRERLADRLTVVRPHGIYGYYIAPEADNQRYWPVRFAAGSRILLGGDGNDGVQFVDVTDLARFSVKLMEDGATGAYNVARRLRWVEYAHALQAFSATPTELYWAPLDFLEAQGIRDFRNLPAWVPRSKGPGFNSIDTRKAEAAGLVHRPLVDLVRDMLAGTSALYPSGYDLGKPGQEGHLDRATEQAAIDKLIAEGKRLAV